MNTLENNESAENIVEVNIIKALRSYGFNMDDLELSQFSEAFRHIKRPLLRKAAKDRASGTDEGKANVVMVVSAHPAEGKTFVASNLAVSMAAEKDKSVLLIDADVARSSVSEFFGIEAEHGFVEYLLGEVPNLADVVLETNKSNFRILPVGRRYQHATELFSSENTAKLMRDIASASQERIVIIDSPPLFAATESLALAELAGQIVVVVESGGNQKELKDALALLDLSRVTGAIFNKSRNPSRPYYYGYGDE